MDNEKRYFHAKPVNPRNSMITDYGILLELNKDNFKPLNIKSSLDDLGIYIDREGKYCIKNKDYLFNEVSKTEAENIIYKQELEWRNWGSFMSSSENISSTHIGIWGENLF